VIAIAPPKEAPDRGGHGGDLIFRLKCADAVVFVLGEFVEDVAGGSDRITPQKQFAVAQLGGGEKTEGGRLVPGDVSILAGLEPGFFDAKLAGEGIRRFAVIESGLQRAGIGLGDMRLSRELVLDEAQRRFQGTIVKPENQAHGIEVSTAVGVLGSESQAVDRLSIELRHVDREKLIFIQ
jgi:hypothetical protein